MKKPIFFLLLAAVATSCTWDHVPEPSPCFSEDIQPILVANCAMEGCHNPIDMAEDLDLTTFAGVRSIVKPGKPGDSKLLKVVRQSGEDRMPPSPYDPLTQAQIDLIQQWIEAGALEVSPCNSANCDSLSGVSYAVDVVPLLDAYCMNCHSGSTPSGGVDLSTYAGVSASVANGSLVGSILYEGSWIPMPWNSAPLSDCKKKTIQTWVNEGALNN